jgi:hypothetical protein
MSDKERVSRRSFLRAASATATLAAAGTMVAGTMMAATTSRAATIGPDVVVSPGSPLIIDNSVRLQHVRLRGGQIVINGGDVITIDRLTNE